MRARPLLAVDWLGPRDCPVSWRYVEEMTPEDFEGHRVHCVNWKLFQSVDSRFWHVLISTVQKKGDYSSPCLVVVLTDERCSAVGHYFSEWDDVA